jgi:PhzF family phenazine biosynthesis protein
MTRRFAQVDVFGGGPLGGNPVAVVLDGDGLSDAEMQRFANWTNLSEAAFVLPPTTPDADYRVRIFTTAEELPFAGHPTLGSCHAWLDGREPPTRIVQETAGGLVKICATQNGLGFAAPPLVRSGPVDGDLLARMKRILGVDDVLDAHWVDNGPGWVAVLLQDADAVLALQPGDLEGLFVGAAGLHPDGDLEVRGFFTGGEDPVTGSLNASLAQWLLGSGRLTAPYVARQGTVLGRTGRVHISEGDGEIWVAGATRTVVSGEVDPDA